MNIPELVVFKRVLQIFATKQVGHTEEILYNKVLTNYQILLPITEDIKNLVGDNWLKNINTLNIQWVDKIAPLKKLKKLLTPPLILSGIEQQGWYNEIYCPENSRSIDLSVCKYEYYDFEGDLVSDTVTEEGATEASYFRKSRRSYEYLDGNGRTVTEYCSEPPSVFSLNKEDYLIDGAGIAFAISFMIRKLQWEHWSDEVRILQDQRLLSEQYKNDKCKEEIEIFNKLSEYFNADRRFSAIYTNILSVPPFKSVDEAWGTTEEVF